MIKIVVRETFRTIRNLCIVAIINAGILMTLDLFQTIGRMRYKLKRHRHYIISKR